MWHASLAGIRFVFSGTQCSLAAALKIHKPVAKTFLAFPIFHFWNPTRYDASIWVSERIKFWILVTMCCLERPCLVSEQIKSTLEEAFHWLARWQNWKSLHHLALLKSCARDRPLGSGDGNHVITGILASGLAALSHHLHFLREARYWCFRKCRIQSRRSMKSMFLLIWRCKMKHRHPILQMS